MSYWSSVLIQLLKDKQNEFALQQQQNAQRGRAHGGGKMQLALQNGEEDSGVFSISIDEMSRLTCITTDDIVECLKTLSILVWYKGKWVFSETNLNQVFAEQEEKRLKAQKKMTDNTVFVAGVDPSKLHWTPFLTTKRQKTQ